MRDEDRGKDERRTKHPSSPRPPTLKPLQQKGRGAAAKEPEQTGRGYRDSAMDAAATKEAPLGRRAGRCGPGGGGVGHDGRRRCRMVGRGACRRHRGAVSAATQQSTHGGARIYTNNTYPVQRLGKDGEEKDIPTFSYSSFDAVTTTTATDAAPADDAKAQAKGSFKEEAADGTAGADWLFNALVTADGGGGSSSSSSTSLNKFQSQQ